MAGAIHSTGKTDYNTPPDLVAVVREFFGGTIDLDPCSNPTSVVGATRELMLDRGEDGLQVAWTGKVFVNPPFGRGAEAWVRKAERYCGVVEVVMLLPVDTSTRLWQDIILPGFAAVCFLRGRPKFLGAKTGIPKPCAFLYYGADEDRFRDVFGKIGRCLV